MATAELAGADPIPAARDRTQDRAPRRAAPLALVVALIALLTYAAFAGGASLDPDEARAQVALAAIAAFAGGAWLWGGGIRLAAPRLAWAGVALLFAFAVWTGVTVLWSVAPDQTWLELNRVLSYVLIVLLGIAAGASDRRNLGRFAHCLLALVMVVTVYALGQKIAPGLHISGLFDLNQTSISPRLRAPLDYWNALALFIAFGVPIALSLAVDTTRSERLRLAALLSMSAMFVALGPTYSRGALAALAIGLLVALGLGGNRVRGLVALAASGLAAAPALAFVLTDPALTGLGEPLKSRETAGAVLGAALVIPLIALWFAGRWLLRREGRAEVSEQTRRRLRRIAPVAVAALLALGLIGVAASHRGIGGTASHFWHSFTADQSTSIYSSNRLLSTSAGNRLAWWKEAAGAWSAKPVAGWGAGSFPVLDLLYRHTAAVTVRQPHELPLQFLAETGIVGAVLGIGALALLLTAAVMAVRSRRAGAERLLAAALLAAPVAFLIQMLVDWDWDIPGVALPALAALGVLVGAVRAPDERVPGPRPLLPPGPGPGARLLAVGAWTLAMCLFAVSAVLPSLAASDAQSSLVQGAGSSPSALRAALARASLASRLDPLSDAGMLAQATIAVHAGDLSGARRDLLAAIDREPDDVNAWAQLATVEQLAGDTPAYRLAARHALALDPYSTARFISAAVSLQSSAPSRESATATGTPLPTAPVGFP
jgi:hypothetical protein